MITINVPKSKSKIDAAVQKCYSINHNASLYAIFFNDKPVLCANGKYRKSGVVFLLNREKHDLVNSTSYQLLSRIFVRFGNSVLLLELDKAKFNSESQIKPYDGETPHYGTAQNFVYSELATSFQVIDFIAAGYCESLNPNLISSWNYSFEY